MRTTNYKSALTVIFILIWSIILGNHTLLQTRVGMLALSVCLVTLGWAFYREQHPEYISPDILRLSPARFIPVLKRAARQKLVPYLAVIASITYLNITIHPVFDTQPTQIAIDLLTSHDARININGHPCHLIYNKRAFLSASYRFNVYVRDGLFYKKVNDTPLSCEIDGAPAQSQDVQVFHDHFLN